jgi:hypothetical protein
MPSDRLQRVLRTIDEANAQDPRAYELPYSQWVTDWVKRLEPHASEELLISARGQHIRRWEIPRENYPDNRKGYLLWRETLKGLHAEQVGKIMREAGYPEESIEKAARIILKKNIRDPESQTVEDALCLVFLERQFEELSKKEPEEKMVEILRKSWRKMGEKGRAEALKLPLSEPEKALLQKALG